MLSQIALADGPPHFVPPFPRERSDLIQERPALGKSRFPMESAEGRSRVFHLDGPEHSPTLSACGAGRQLSAAGLRRR